MSEETILTWNVTNWVTVVLMGVVGFGILKVVSTWAGKKFGGGS